MERIACALLLALSMVSLTACGDDSGSDAGPDAESDVGEDAGPPDVGDPDTGPVVPASVDHCSYEALGTTANAGGVVTAGALTAGTAEAGLDMPIGATLGAYTSRNSGFGNEGSWDEREPGISGSFNASVGVETTPRARVLVLTAREETVVLVKLDIGSSYSGLLHDLEARLGDDFMGKVLVAASHSHSSFGHYNGHKALGAGFGEWRRSIYERLLNQLVGLVEEALDSRIPAQLGVAHNGDFDPEDRVSRDRRSENDELDGGRGKDHDLFVIRVDSMTGEPLALLPVFGMHGTTLGGENALASTESSGGVERVLEERFDSKVLVMHLQGAAGDVSPTGRGATNCEGRELCHDYARTETVGRAAVSPVLAAWEAAGEAMQSELELEMLTRSVELGPNWETFSIRDGALEYAPFDASKLSDGEVYDDAGQLISPIDEFNAPYGATLCDLSVGALIGPLRGSQSLDYTYRGCNRVEEAAPVLGAILGLDIGETPICDTTRTTVSALRIGEYVIGTLPGEPVTLVADHIRALSPVDPDKTIVVGYAQDHVGYILRPEDWLAGGYEPSITFWGPLEGEYIAEQLASLLPLAMTPEREDGVSEGTDRVATPTAAVMFEADPAPDAGTVPSEVPAVLTRLMRTVPSAQPAPRVERLQSVFFTFIGEDPLEATPKITLEREAGDDEWELLVRRSGRPVTDAAFILTWTPDPLMPDDADQTHYFTVEFQAVAPMGTEGEGDIAARRGLPLGNYRFVVEGAGYTLMSDSFEVTPAALALETTASGDDLEIDVTMSATDGFRLLDEQVVSNGPVPLRGATMRYTLMTDAGETEGEVTLDGMGHGVIEEAGPATLVSLRDEFGNAATL